MPDTTIPDALALDLRELYLSAPPAGLAIPAEDVRLKHSVEELPSPRLVMLTGDPRRQPRMDGTALVPISVEYITSMDRVTPEEHSEGAGKIDAWWKAIRASKRGDVLFQRVYLHEIITLQPVNGIRKDEREQTTTIRGDMMVTMIAPI